MKKIYIILLVIFINSCGNHTYNISRTVSSNNASYINESSLLEVSLEKINFSSSKSENINKIIQLIETKRPSKAELSCDPTSINCAQIKRILLSFSVVIKNLPTISDVDSSDVSLIYEKISNIDCYQKFGDVNDNVSRIEPPLGCAVTSNIIEMVNNKDQFISPKLLSLQDSTTAINAIRKK